MSNKDSLEKELKILKEALRCAKAGDAEGVADKFVQLCEHQQEVMEQEARDATTQIINNAQRYARSKVSLGYVKGNQGFKNQETDKGKES
jgi:hypothetical protein